MPSGVRLERADLIDDFVYETSRGNGYSNPECTEDFSMNVSAGETRKRIPETFHRKTVNAFYGEHRFFETADPMFPIVIALVAS